MGTQILYDSGYDPRGMGQFLEKIQGLDQGNHRVAFFNDHPSPDGRFARVAEEVDQLGAATHCELMVIHDAGSVGGALQVNANVS